MCLENDGGRNGERGRGGDEVGLECVQEKEGREEKDERLWRVTSMMEERS